MEKNHAASNDGCCKDEFKVIKNTKDQKLTQADSYLFQITFVPHLPPQNDLPAITISSLTEGNPVSHAPPRSQVAIYLRNRVFLI